LFFFAQSFKFGKGGLNLLIRFSIALFAALQPDGKPAGAHNHIAHSSSDTAHTGKDIDSAKILAAIVLSIFLMTLSLFDID